MNKACGAPDKGLVAVVTRDLINRIAYQAQFGAGAVDRRACPFHVVV